MTNPICRGSAPLPTRPAPQRAQILLLGTFPPVWVFQRVWARAWPIAAEVSFPGDRCRASTAGAGRVNLAEQGETSVVKDAVSPRSSFSVATSALLQPGGCFTGACGVSCAQEQPSSHPGQQGSLPSPLSPCSLCGLSWQPAGAVPSPQSSSGGGDGVRSPLAAACRGGFAGVGQPHPSPRVPRETEDRMSALCRRGVGWEPLAALSGQPPTRLRLTLLPPARSHL